VCRNARGSQEFASTPECGTCLRVSSIGAVKPSRSVNLILDLDAKLPVPSQMIHLVSFNVVSFADCMRVFVRWGAVRWSFLAKLKDQPRDQGLEAVPNCGAAGGDKRQPNQMKERHVH